MKACINTLIVLLFLSFLSCQEEDHHKPASMTFTINENSIVYAGETIKHIGVQVLDHQLVPNSGLGITFQITSGDAALSGASGTTDANGTAYVDVSFGSNSSEVILTASGGGLEATLKFRVSSGHASKIVMVSGNELNGVVGDVVQLSVQVTDDFGTPAENTTVTFKVMTGGGTVSSPTVRSGEDGNATINFNLGSNEVENKITASISTDSVHFSIYGSAVPSLQPLVKSNDGITLNWTQAFAHHLTKYTISRSGADNVWKEIGQVSASVFSFKDLNVVQASMYQYRVTAVTSSLNIQSGIQSIEFGLFAVLDDMPVHMVIDEARLKVYVSIPSKNEIEVVDIASGEVVDRIFIGSKPQRMNISHDGTTLYVALGGSGRVAFLNLNSKSITEVDVQSALGDPRAFDVVEGAPGRVFVSANPEGYGISYIALIKTDENNKVERFFNEVVRDHPIMQVQYDKALYVMQYYNIYLLDLSIDYQSIPIGSISPDMGFMFSKRSLDLNQKGSAYLDYQQFSADLKTLEHTFDPGIVSASDDGQILTSYSYTSIVQWLNSTTYQVLKQIPFSASYVYEISTSKDGKTCYVLSTNYSDFRLWILMR